MEQLLSIDHSYSKPFLIVNDNENSSHFKANSAVFNRSMKSLHKVEGECPADSSVSIEGGKKSVSRHSVLRFDVNFGDKLRNGNFQTT